MTSWQFNVLLQVVWRPNPDILEEEGIIIPQASLLPSDQQQQEGEDAAGSSDDDEEEAPSTTSSTSGSSAEAEKQQRVVVVEQGIKLYASPMGQKTGFYADQVGPTGCCWMLFLLGVRTLSLGFRVGS